MNARTATMNESASDEDRNAARRQRASRRRRRAVFFLGGIVFEATAVWLRTGRLGGNLIVRCRQGHLFTTTWIPAISVKAVRLGWWRLQRCPVGKHWSLVTPMRESDLTEEERRTASEVRDVRIP